MLKKMLAYAAVGLALVASATVRADDRKDIEAMFAKLDKAISAKDVNTVKTLYVKDMTFTDSGAKMTGVQIVSLMDQQLKAIPSIKSKHTVESCTVKGNQATVKTSDVTNISGPDPGGKQHTMVSSNISNDVLVKTSAGWVFKSITVLSKKLTMDGKPFTPMQRPAKGK